MKTQTKWLLGAGAGAAALGFGYFLYRKGKQVSEALVPGGEPLPALPEQPQTFAEGPPVPMGPGVQYAAPPIIETRTDSASVIEPAPESDGKSETKTVVVDRTLSDGTTTTYGGGTTPGGTTPGGGTPVPDVEGTSLAERRKYDDAVAALKNLTATLAAKGFKFVRAVPTALVPMSGDPWGALAYLKSLPGAGVWNIQALTDKAATKAWFMASFKSKPLYKVYLAFTPTVSADTTRPNATEAIIAALSKAGWTAVQQIPVGRVPQSKTITEAQTKLLATVGLTEAAAAQAGWVIAYHYDPKAKDLFVRAALKGNVIMLLKRNWVPQATVEVEGVREQRPSGMTAAEFKAWLLETAKALTAKGWAVIAKAPAWVSPSTVAPQAAAETKAAAQELTSILTKDPEAAKAQGAALLLYLAPDKSAYVGVLTMKGQVAVVLTKLITSSRPGQTTVETEGTTGRDAARSEAPPTGQALINRISGALGSAGWVVTATNPTAFTKQGTYAELTRVNTELLNAIGLTPAKATQAGLVITYYVDGSKAQLYAVASSAGAFLRMLYKNPWNVGQQNVTSRLGTVAERVTAQAESRLDTVAERVSTATAQEQMAKVLKALAAAGLSVIPASSVPAQRTIITSYQAKAQYDMVRKLIGPKFDVSGYIDKSKKNIFLKFYGVAADTKALAPVWMQMKSGGQLTIDDRKVV